MEASDGFSAKCLGCGYDAYTILGQYFRGLAFYKGLCGPVNYKDAAKWFTEVAQNNSCDRDYYCIQTQCKQSAMYYLGFMYYYGQGVEVDYGKAVSWIMSAFGVSEIADAPEAKAVLGDAYLEGHGVDQSYDLAEHYYKETPSGTAAGAYAQKRLGDMYRDGTGVKQDYCEALEHYQQAAEWGSADAQNCLADMYRNGQGVDKDPAEAMKWYMKAAQNGSSEARKKIMEMMGGFAQSGISPDSAQKEITD